MNFARTLNTAAACRAGRIGLPGHDARWARTMVGRRRASEVLLLPRRAGPPPWVGGVLGAGPGGPDGRAFTPARYRHAFPTRRRGGTRDMMVRRPPGDFFAPVDFFAIFGDSRHTPPHAAHHCSRSPDRLGMIEGGTDISVASRAQLAMFCGVFLPILFEYRISRDIAGSGVKRNCSEIAGD